MNTLIIRILLLALFAFACIRSALYFLYPDYFSQISNMGIVMFNGMRFDGKLTVLLLIPIFLLLLLPFGKLNNRLLRRSLVWIALFELLLCFGIAIADLAYFGEVKRHIGSEILNLGSDIGFLWQTAFGSRIQYTIAGTMGLAIFALLWYVFVIRFADRVSETLKKRAIWSCIQLLLLVFLARGMVLQGKPLSSIDAFDGARHAQANLTLNPALVTLDAVRKRQYYEPLVYLNAEQSQAFSNRYPQAFYYQSLHQPSKKNIVFILLESWSYRYIDALSGSAYGVTPNMDRLVAKSRIWENFYAAGQRSIIGIQAALTSVPALPNREPLGFGLELNNMSRIAELISKQDYRTLMVQSSKRRSFHMDGIAKALGFQEYYAQEDIPLIRSYPQAIPPFGWDYDTLMFLGKQLTQQSEKPFFAFLFTGTTHEPFAHTGEEFRHYPHDEKDETGFLNTLAYSDWALGQFMDYAAQQSWYDNTIFIFCADHTLNSGEIAEDVQERFHIPLVIFNPSAPIGIRHSELASQYDLLPTLVDILGIQSPVYTFGQSLNATPHQALPLLLQQEDSIVMLAEDGDFAEMREGKIIDGNAEHADLPYWQWRMQSADERLRQNTWVQ